LLLFVVVAFIAKAQPGTIDPTFNPTDLGFGIGDGANDGVYTSAIQSDGKIIMGGYFTSYNGTARKAIARLNTDGYIDSIFNVGTGANNFIQTIAIQSDGKIIIGGNFTSYNGTAINCIARLNADGSLDPTFNPGTGASSNVKTTAIQSDGKIIIGGGFSTYNGISRNYIARLNTDGSLDTTFNVGTGANSLVLTTAIQSDGKIIMGGYFTSYNGTARKYIARLNTDGSLDATFNPGTGANNDVQTIAIQGDGKIIIGGEFTSYNGTAINRIARLNTDGSLDPTFNVGTGTSYIVYTTVIQSDGKIIMGGGFSTYNGTVINGIARLNTDGSLDPTFNVGTGANDDVETIAIQSDGKIIMGGSFTSYNGPASKHIARLNADGSLDNTFNIGTGANNAVETTTIQSDGKIIIGGWFTSYNGKAINRIARLNADGTVDTLFNVGTGTNDYVYTTAIQSDGKIIIGGNFTSYNGTAINRIARLNADGSLDPTFNVGTGASSIVKTIAIQSDGKIIISGWFNAYNGTARNYIARVNADGSLDNTFNIGTGTGTVLTTAIQSDGKIIMGSNASYNGIIRSYITRLNADGSLDPTFNVGTGTGASSEIFTSAIQSDGKIIIGGQFNTYNGTASRRIARLNTDGNLDTTFNVGTGASPFVSTIAIQSDGKIIIGGTLTSYNGTAINHIARLNADGSLDPTFNVGTGANYYKVCATAIQRDGKIIMGGNFTSYNGIGRNRIARLDNNTITPCTFPANATFTTTKVNCTNPNSGTTTVNVNGGTSPYSYNWSNGSIWPTATGLAVGNYNVTIYDNNGCTFSSSVNITKYRCATLGPSPINVPFIQMPGAIIPR